MKCLSVRQRRCVLSCLLLGSIGAGLRADVLITEFMASNSRTLIDEDGDSSDWIELFNDGAAAVNLDGWFLSNSKSDLTQWRFPAVTLPAQQHLLVFASGKNRAIPGRPLHTGFKLASDGDYLALIEPDGHTVATEFDPQYPIQVTDVSYGIPVKQTVASLVATGAVGKLLVPTIDFGAADWTAVNFDDSGWTDVATGVGFEVVANAPEPTVIADSVADFGGTQGGSRWFYGFYDRTADVNTSYSAAEFQLFPNDGGALGPGNYFDGTLWRSPSAPPFTQVGAMRMRPNGSANGSELWPVRRWLSTVDGSVEVEWTLAKEIAAGSGVTGRVYQKGAQKDLLTIAGDDTTGATHKVTLTGLKVGDPVDFLLTPAGIGDAKDATGDLATFTVRVRVSASLDAQIKSGIGDAMHGHGASAFLRLPFTVADPSAFSLLALRMKYDDGFVAYLNGVEVARAYAPDELAWDSAATEAHSDFAATGFEEFDLTRRIGLLHAGANVLAIQGLNLAVDDNDFLILPELVATGTVLDKSARRYFSPPTPGAANGEGNTHFGPLIRDVGHSPDEPTDDQNLVVTAQVLPTFEAVAGATLNYAVMFGSVVGIPMFDDGAHGDGAAGDGVFGASIPASAANPGQMVRYFVTATDASGDLSRWPAFVDKKKSPEYLGTVVRDPNLTNKLPVFHWFIKTPSTADGAGARCSIYFDGEFYDNVFAGLHGQSSQSFPKRSYNFDMNPRARFRYDDTGLRVDDFNLLTTYPDKAHVRNMLAYETHRDAGCAYHVVIPMRIQQNGKFWGDAHWVEDGGEDYLSRLGLDPRGALYKMYNTFDSATSGVEKKTRKWESNSDLQAFMTGLAKAGANRRAFLYDNVNIPAMINYLAIMPITANIDCCHKNYYTYRDSEGTGEWTFFPWDQDLSFGRNWTGSLAYFDDTVYFQNPLYVGDNNALIQAVFADAGLKQMYHRRVRTLMDQLVQNTNVPPALRYYERRINQLADQIEPDAVLDFAKWPTWGKKMTMPQSVAQMLTNYFPKRRKFLFVDQVTPRGPLPVAQPAAAVVTFGAFEINPASGNQDQEYVELKNANNYAVDISGWQVTGDIQHTLAPGTVLPANGKLYLTRRAKAFRARTTAPTGGQGLFVQGGYQGQLSARGGTLTLMDGAREVATLTLPSQPTPAQQYLRVSEIMFAPAALPGDGPFDAGEFEFIELENTGPAALDLTAVRLAGGIEFAFASSALKQLPAGGFAVVVKNPAAFHSRYGIGIGIAGEYSGRLDNAGESLRIEDHGEVVLDFFYDARWLPFAAGGGYSMQVIDPLADWKSWSARSQWRLSAAVGGTPGQSDEAFNTWRTQHFNAAELLDASISGSAADPDGDGATNLHEFGAGTDPRDPASQLRLAALGSPDAGGQPLRLQFDAMPGRSYGVQSRDTLDAGSWTTLEAFPPHAAARVVTVSDPGAGAAGERLYRVVTPAVP